MITTFSSFYLLGLPVFHSSRHTSLVGKLVFCKKGTTPCHSIASQIFFTITCSNKYLKMQKFPLCPIITMHIDTIKTSIKAKQLQVFQWNILIQKDMQKSLTAPWQKTQVINFTTVNSLSNKNFFNKLGSEVTSTARTGSSRWRY